jgi:hypothetical protein
MNPAYEPIIEIIDELIEAIKIEPGSDKVFRLRDVLDIYIDTLCQKASMAGSSDPIQG